ncbi:MAG: hypothetical protein CJBNEKGG_04006 [Prosthecobacter sp.]|nr:hypothetical protein [Prosthecobacter sp.]
MKPQTKLTLVLISAYSFFMLWWFLREDVPKLGISKAAGVSIQPKAKKAEPVASVGRSDGTNSRLPLQGEATLPSGRVVVQASAQHIKLGEEGGFAPYRWPGSPPAYPGEAVTAFVRVSSTKMQQALTVNQAGEFPRMMTQPGETVQVRLAFTQSKPGSPVALSSEDGGLIESTWRTTAGKLDAARQLAFAYTVSKNPGIHRISIRTPSGESKILEFWAGQPLALKKP